MMSQAIRIHQTGGPEVMRWEAVTLGEPQANEVRIRNTAIGLNYIDTYHRSGLYPVTLPSGLGLEAAAVIEALGAQVTDLHVGDRVAYCGGPLGAYSEVRNIPADRLVKLPEQISDQQAATVMLKGLTVQYLFRQTYRLHAGQTILFHAAAGGVGSIACQWAKALGVTMIGTVSSEEKAKLARTHGCQHTIIYTKENVVARVKELTQGRGVPVVYDSVGQATFSASLDCLQPRGMLVSYGNTSGAVRAFDLGLLSSKGSLYVTRPSLNTYTTRREDLLAMAEELFDLMLTGKIKSEPQQTFALREAAFAHHELEAGKTVGSSILLPL